MSYCMFENTLQDLRQVRDRLREVDSMEELLEEASEHEIEAIKALPMVCAKILEYYDDL